MEGKFCKKGFGTVYNLVGLISGLISALLFGCLIGMEAVSDVDDLIASWFFLIFGFVVSSLCGIALYVNRKAYIHIDEQKICAFCHYGLSLECDLAEVSNVSYGHTGLNIQLKNGKKYNLMNLENAHEIGKYIQKRIAVESTKPLQKDALMEAFTSLRKKRKVEAIASVCCFALLIPYLVLSFELTGWKDMQDFSANDWFVVTVMAAVSLVTLLVFCILLRKCLLHTEELVKMRGGLCRVILRTTPVQHGNAVKLYIDDNFDIFIRLTVYGYPNSSEVYFIEEYVNQDFKMECIRKSEVYSSMDELAAEIDGMTQIELP